MSSIYGIFVKHGKVNPIDLLTMGARTPASSMRALTRPGPSDPFQQAPGVEGQIGWGTGERLGDWVVQWNGEIYNRSTLQRLLALPPNASDSALILNGWQREESGFFSRINGPFALALWDLKAKNCILARSTQGPHVVFWFESDQGVAFAQEIASVLRCPWVPKEPNWARISEYLVFDHVAGGETLYNGLRELLPGEVLNIDLRQGITTLHRPPIPPIHPPPDISGEPDLLKRTFSALVASTGRLFAVGPTKHTGLFLSGGVDSALLAAALKTIARGRKLPCLTVICPGYKHDEAVFARMVRDQLDLPGVEIPLDPATFAAAWQEAVRALGAPLTSTNQVPWWILCGAAKARQWSAAFSGEGADGWISGGLYDDERSEIAQLWDARPEEAAIRMILCRTHTLNDPALIDRILGIPLDLGNRREIWEDIREEMKGGATDDLAVHYHVRTTGHRLLTRADQVARYHGMRLRLPYLEGEWLGWIRTLPFHVRNARGVRKRPLKDLCARRWGEAFAHRKKIGFPFPLRTWIRDAPEPLLRQWREMLLDHKTLSRDIYHKEELMREIRLRLEKRIRPSDWLLWSLINLELWLRDIGR